MAVDPIAVVGGGAWGTALAQAAAAAGREVILWMRAGSLIEDIAANRVNRRYLPDVRLDAAVRVTASMEDIRAARAVLLVVPAQAVREIFLSLAPHLAADA